MIGFTLTQELRDVMKNLGSGHRVWTNKQTRVRSVKCYTFTNDLVARKELRDAVEAVAQKLPGAVIKEYQGHRRSLVVQIPIKLFA